MVGVVAVFLLQLGVWTITWIILPIAQHSYALVQYLRGRAPWHEVASLHGLSTFRPSWVGPRAGTEWSSAYIQQEVRGRGDSREPHDLLVTDGLAVARLRHGTLRGRTNRHGFKCSCNGVHSSPTGTSGTSWSQRDAVSTFALKILVEPPRKRGGTFLQVPLSPGTKPTTCKKRQAEDPWGGA